MIATATVRDVRLDDPLRAGAASVRPLILLRLEAADGLVGHGEAAPLEEYDGVSVERVLQALATHTSALATNEWPEEDVRAACAEADPLPQALGGGGPGAVGPRRPPSRQSRARAAGRGRQRRRSR